MSRAGGMFKFEVRLLRNGEEEYAEFRVAMHPSESVPFLLARVLAFLIEHRDGIEFGAPLCEGDEPAILVREGDGRITLWVEIGVPDIRRLKRAGQAGRRLCVYSHRDPAPLLKDLAREDSRRLQALAVFVFETRFLSALESRLDRNNTWELEVDGDQLLVRLDDGEEISGKMKQVFGR